MLEVAADTTFSCDILRKMSTEKIAFKSQFFRQKLEKEFAFLTTTSNIKKLFKSVLEII